jgi:hypothetical protein
MAHQDETTWDSGLHVMRNKKLTLQRCLWLVAFLIIALSRSFAAEDGTSEAPLLDAPSTSTATSATSGADSSQNTPEPPIENAATARPSLKYEPSERISEDSSVSFPVDI